MNEYKLNYRVRREKGKQVNTLIKRVKNALGAKKFYTHVDAGRGWIAIRISVSSPIGASAKLVTSKDYLNWGAEEFTTFEAYAIKELTR